MDAAYRSRRRSRLPAHDSARESPRDRDLPRSSSSSALVYSNCSRTGHSEASCWTTNTELHDQAPAFFRDSY